MKPAVAFTQNAQGKIIKKSGGFSQKSPGRPTVLIAVSDPEIRQGLV